MKRRFVQISGELVEVGDNYQPEPRADFHVMDDIKPYRSMVDGQVINSRSTHREHLRAHGCVEVGNETKYLRPQAKQSPQGLKQTLLEVAAQKLKS